MAEPVEALAREAMQLTPEERLALAQKILTSIEPTAPDEIEALWDTEIQARIARHDAGQSPSLSASNVFSELDRRLGR